MPNALRFFVTALLIAAATGLSGATENASAPTPAAALARLKAGNERFVATPLTHPNQTAERRTEVAASQHPFAMVVACADSRVAPEILFDTGLGDLFVVRNAGNLLDDHVLASLEYAVEHLHAPLLVVLGHTRCGAVTAAVQGGELPGHLPSIAESLAPAVAMAAKKPGDRVENAVRIHARLSAAALPGLSPLLAAAVKSGHLAIVAARYDLTTGRVEILD